MNHQPVRQGHVTTPEATCPNLHTLGNSLGLLKELRISQLSVRFILQAFEKKTEVENIRGRNRKLVDNILPEHVADYFLQHQSKDETVTKLNLRAML